MQQHRCSVRRKLQGHHSALIRSSWALMTSPPQADLLVRPWNTSRAGRVWKILSPHLAERVRGWRSWSSRVAARGGDCNTAENAAVHNVLFHCRADFWCFASFEKDILFLGTENNWNGHLLNISPLAIETSFAGTRHSELTGRILGWWKMKWPCPKTAKSHWLQQLCLCKEPHSRKDVTLFPSFPFQRKVGKRKCSLYNQQITILSGGIQFLLV